jgi:hypothetical protein
MAANQDHAIVLLLKACKYLLLGVRQSGQPLPAMELFHALRVRLRHPGLSGIPQSGITETVQTRNLGFERWPGLHGSPQSGSASGGRSAVV